jgi:hypothetical protein
VLLNRYRIYSSGFFDIFSFVVGSNHLAVLRICGSAKRYDLDGARLNLGGDDFLHLLEIVRMIGSDIDNTAFLQNSQYLRHIAVRKKPPFMVASLRPRVGKVQMEAFDALVGDIFGDKCGRVGADYSDVTKIPPADSVNGGPVKFVGPFDPQKINIFKGLSLIYQKSAFARANLNMDRTGTTENIVEIDHSINIFRFKRYFRVILQRFVWHLLIFRLIYSHMCKKAFCIIIARHARKSLALE